MKVIRIELAQFQQLRSLKKSFVLCWYPSWRIKDFPFFLRSIVHARVDTLFVLYLRGSCEAENFVIDELGARSVPIVTGYRDGQLHFLLDQSNLTELSWRAEALPRFGSAALTTEEIIAAILDNPDPSLPCLRIFVAGDRSTVGKTSVCYGLLAALTEHFKIQPKLVAYIKPATQCEAPQTISFFCESKGIACRAIGPVVFYKGFTRAFLSNELGLTSADLLQQVSDSVADLERGRRLVLVDGVGYPAVGSIVGLSNADVAAKLRTPVLLIGKSGVGDAVDSYTLNSTFFEHHNVPVLGAIFNKLEVEGFYNRDACAEAVTAYFAQRKPSQMPYGFVSVVSPTALEWNPDHGADEWVRHFLRFVDLGRLVHDVWQQNLLSRQISAEEVDLPAAQATRNPVPQPPVQPPLQPPPPPQPQPQPEPQSRKRSREEIEAAAASQGAKGG